MPSLKAYSLALLTFVILTTPFHAHQAAAQPDPRPTIAALEECAPMHPLRILLPDNFERVPSDNPAVLCIFRNKIKGFPTLNIVVEPRHEGSPPPTLAEYEEGIRRGYQSVGLSDATLSESTIGQSQRVPYFTSEVSFTNVGMAMKARILVLQLHDRTYTASAVGKAVPGSTELQNLISNIEVEGARLDLSGDGDALSGLVATVVGVLLALLVAVLFRKRLL